MKEMVGRWQSSTNQEIIVTAQVERNGVEWVRWHYGASDIKSENCPKYRLMNLIDDFGYKKVE